MPMPPAQLLEGLTLDSGWLVEKLMTRSSTQTGGAFSSAYRLLKPNGESAFLKAMDFNSALTAADPAVELKKLADAFVFEREIVELCGSKKLSRIVRAIGSGKIMSIATPDTPSQIVQYLIFELAEGDLRQAMSAQTSFDLAWTLKRLHEIFVAAEQLHIHGIVHQDIKPSNVLGCGDDGAKLGDLGRAWHAAISAPHDSLRCAGALSYAAPESLYRGAALTDDERRYGADFYLLGSMVCFMLTGLRSTASLTACLPIVYHWKNWPGTYEQVLPYLEHAFADMSQKMRLTLKNDELWAEISPLITQMCDPSIKRRGDRQHGNALGSRFQLRRFVSRLYTLHVKAKLGKLKAA